MLDIGRLGLVCNSRDKDLEPVEALKKALKNPTDQRLFKIAAALKIGLSSQEVYELSGVDPWFLHKFENIIAVERNLRALSLENRRVNKVIRKAKRLGFSDSQIAICLKTDEDIVREFRRRYGVIPVIKQIDTLAAEWPTRTNYIYLTYGGKEDDLSLESDGRKV
ncbi:MAG: carbamoyl phosphate synthase large subunit, partial [Nitrososphaeria archaeon]|nr:carbamoyl phosphate synthase large subunit [Nitrososphaeria archaeon]